MREFKKGDKVRFKEYDNFYKVPTSTVLTVSYADNDSVAFNDNPTASPNYDQFYVDSKALELIKGEQQMSHRRTFKLIKETYHLKKGTLVQEMCDDGDQDFKILDESNVKYEIDDGETIVARDAVTEQPNWFQEVFPATETWLTKDELKAFQEWQKKQGKRK